MNIQILGIFSGLCLLISMAVCFLPKPLAGLVAAMFSYGKLGVRYAQRYRDNRDKLGYLFLLIGFIYSIIFIFIPYQIEKYVFSGIYGYFFLITIAQYYRVYKEERILKRFAALSAICVMASVNYIACVGALNNFGFMGPCA
ncbi:MAG: hypothetical protein KBT48_00435, partial [Firmicutes bacterium]|nr:hypothetical protein [Bacillota bacterium]